MASSTNERLNIGLIMDGNRRWSNLNSKSNMKGYIAGANVLKKNSKKKCIIKCGRIDCICTFNRKYK